MLKVGMTASSIRRIRTSLGIAGRLRRIALASRKPRVRPDGFDLLCRPRFHTSHPSQLFSVKASDG